MQKLIYILLFLPLASFAQTDSIPVKPKQSLRAVLILKDTTAYPFIHQAANKYHLYKFEIDTLLRGEVEGNEIWVMTEEKSIRHFNYEKKPGYPYYWILCEKMKLPDGKIVYRVCGAF